MAQATYTPIQLYFSTTAAAIPTSGNLANGELALNISDMKLYAKNSGGTVTLLASSSGASGTVTSVAQTFTGGIVSVAGSPITTSGTLALTVAGTSGGVPYFSSGTTWATSAALAASALVIGGGAGAAPSTTTTGTGVVTALGVNIGTAGAFVVNGGALGTPSSGTVTNLTGTASININGTVGATTASTGAFTTLSASTTIRTSDGVVGTPTFSFTNETSTGLYRSNNGAISVAILGSEILRFTASGLLLNSNSNTTASIIAGGLNSNNGIIQLGSSGVAYQILGGAYQGNLNLYTGSGGGPIIFTPNATERARITTGLSVGTTSDPGAGAIYATGNITAFFSDKRLKTVSGKIQNALDKVAKLSGVYYTFNDTAKSFGYDSNEEQVGVIAQEVEAVLPQIVKAAPFDLDENNNSKSGENYKTVQYDKLVPLLIEAINELQAKVKALEAK